MATSKGKGGAGRPRKAETVAAHGIATAVASGKVAEPKEQWKARTVYVGTDGTLAALRRKGLEALPMETPTPQAFAGIVVVGKDGGDPSKAAASLRESVGRLLRMDPAVKGSVASVSERFTFDDGTEGIAVLFYRPGKAAPKPVQRKASRKAPATRKRK